MNQEPQLQKKGLTDAEAAARQICFGLNVLPQLKKKSLWLQTLHILKEPMLLLLLVAVTIYLVMGDLGEGLLLGSSIFVIIGISIYQERKSENALASLRELSSPRALVIRNGVEKRIAATQLVPDDLVALHEGDRVPADGAILQASHLHIDESLLTGESFPVQKSALDKPDSELASQGGLDSRGHVFSSTLVVSGTALVKVLKTGSQTEVGKIGQRLEEIVPEELNLNKEIRQLVKLFVWSGALICLAIFLLYGLTRGDWLQAFLVGLATEMALLPEEFPVVLTLFLAMGAWRLSKVQVLIRRPGSIERLGAITVLCVDKTGTLTQNQMKVTQLRSLNPSAPSEDLQEIADWGALASRLDPFDPMEKAIQREAESHSDKKKPRHRDWTFVREYPLSDELLAMSCVWKNSSADTSSVAAKGAPEAILGLCHLDPEQRQQALQAIQEMAQTGLRVLAVAKATVTGSLLPASQREFSFQFLGLIGLEDPLRPEVPAAVEVCHQAGIKVIMMTGDYPETARKIGEKAGLKTTAALMTGAELNGLSDSELEARLPFIHIFARMIPEQKLRIVKLLKQSGQVVAMTGDGVNDAPSLRWADVGIAMGGRGTDVAREASDIVLLDDHFASIVSGIKRGRVIFSNIRKAMSYIVSIHIPIAGLAIFPVLFQWPLMLLPIHIVFLELIIDPACTLMFESQGADRRTMLAPPRSLQTRLFSQRDLLRSSLQGALVLTVISAILWYSLQHNPENPDRARAFAFVILAMSNLGLIFADMSGGSLRQLGQIFKIPVNWLILLGILSTLILITQTPIHSWFYFAQLSLSEFAWSFSIALAIFVLVSTWNWFSKGLRS